MPIRAVVTSRAAFTPDPAPQRNATQRTTQRAQRGAARRRALSCVL